MEAHTRGSIAKLEHGPRVGFAPAMRSSHCNGEPHQQRGAAEALEECQR